MQITRWHVGKIVMLWAWGIAAIVVALQVLRQYEKALTERVLIGFGFLAFVLVIPVMLSILTWHWLGGKEAHGDAPSVKTGQSKSQTAPQKALNSD